MGKRYIIKRAKSCYVIRRRDGTFKKWVNRGKSIRTDSRKKVGSIRIPKTKRGNLKKGYGHQGDYHKRGTLWYYSK